MEKELTTKQKLTTILHNVIEKTRLGAKVEAKAIHAILSVENFHKTIREKLEIFENVPEESKIFSIFYDTAKRALGDLNKNIVNIHAFELVKLFYTLDENFKKNLISQEFIEKEFYHDAKEITEQTFCEEIKEKKERKENIVELPEGTTGQKFLLTKIADQKSFDDLSEALNNL